MVRFGFTTAKRVPPEVEVANNKATVSIFAMGAVLAAASASHVYHRCLAACDASRPAKRSYTTARTTLRLAACTYRALVSDVFYLRAINTYGDRAQSKLGYPQLAELLSAAVLIDPYAIAPYLVAGFALPFARGGETDARRLLAQGASARPDAWQLRFLYGYLLSQTGQYAEAAREMGEAAVLPNAPAHLGPLAVRLAAEGDDPALGLMLLDSFADQIDDPGANETLVARRAQLLYQVQIAQLNDRARQFAVRFGRTPTHFAELAQDTLLPAVDPWGAPYSYDAVQGVTSSNGARRLRVHRAQADNEADP